MVKSPVEYPPDDLPTGEVAEVGRALATWRLPPDLTSAAARQRMELALDSAWREQYSVTQHTRRDRLLWAWLIIRSQGQIVHRLTWIMTSLIMLIGTALSMLLAHPADLTGLPFALMAPVVAAFGVAFLYGMEVDPALELALAAPVSPRLILLARLALVFGFNLGMGVIGSALLASLNPEWTLWGVVEVWLAPMAFLSALAFLLSVLFFEPLTSAMICLSVWAALVVRSVNPFDRETLAALLPNLLGADYRPLLALLAVGMMALALVMAGREERGTLKLHNR